MKNDRQTAIAEIISNNAIEKQDVLIELLREAGFEAAQATVSRDLRQMNITKVSDGNGGLRYSLPPVHAEMNYEEYAMAYAVSVVSVDYSLNNVVIKTRTGMANAVAVGLDAIHVSTILGCVAGDDTIIVITRTEEDAKVISDNIHRMIDITKNKK